MSSARTLPATLARALALIGACAVFAAGCGDSDDNSASNSAAAGAKSASGAAAGIPAELKAQVESWFKRPSNISITEPIGKPVPKGKHIYYISCGGLACNTAAASMESAASKLGWTVKSLSAKTPQEFKAAAETAVRQNADALLWWSFSGDAVKPEITTLKGQNKPVVTTATFEETDAGQPSPTNKPNPGITATVYPGDEILATIVKLADIGIYYGGMKAKILKIAPAGFDFTKPQNVVFKEEIAKQCPDCEVSETEIPYSAIGKTSVQTLTDLIRTQKPDVVVTGTDDFLLGLPQALKAAGLDLPILVSSAPSENGLQAIENGELRASFAFPIQEYSWASMDALARYFAGVSVKPSIEPMPPFLITKENLPGTKLFPNDPNFQQAFTSLWSTGA